MNVTFSDTRRLLLVDDDPDFLIETALLLEANGYEVKKILHSDRVLRILSSYRPDAILLDLEMPEIDGLELLRLLRNRAYGEHLPAILLTGTGSQNILETGFEFGLDDYLAKPFSENELLLRLQAILRRADRTAHKIYTSWESLQINTEFRSILLWRKGYKEISGSNESFLLKGFENLTELWLQRMRNLIINLFPEIHLKELPMIKLSEELIFIKLPNSVSKISLMELLQYQSQVLKRAWQRIIHKSGLKNIIVPSKQGLKRSKLPQICLRWLNSQQDRKFEIFFNDLKLVLSLEHGDDLVRQIDI